MAYVKFKGVKKIFPNGFQAVHSFDLDVLENEFIVLVGPSGCGKTTTLRMLAGLETLTEGEIYIKDKKVNDLEPKDRNIAMVFQNYALYPHMTIYDNLVYGLKVQKVPQKEIDARVKEAIQILGFPEEYLKRKPVQLSGGQKQRVALGRTIVRRPAIFLMDEPLSNLDAKLRVQMRYEINRIHREVKATTIYVTHDQVEAMTMADRIVVMNDGVIQQIGSPDEVYRFPANMFVATFIGAPTMNMIKAKYQNQKIIFQNGYEVALPKALSLKTDDIMVGIRPDDIEVSQPVNKHRMNLTIDNTELLGHDSILYGQMSKDEQLVVKLPTVQLKKMNLNKHEATISLHFSLENLHLFDSETQQRLSL
ncbi:MAG: ABC transporter ATP-binding protein [Bacilli bacterium]